MSASRVLPHDGQRTVRLDVSGLSQQELTEWLRERGPVRLLDQFDGEWVALNELLTYPAPETEGFCEIAIRLQLDDLMRVVTIVDRPASRAVLFTSQRFGGQSLHLVEYNQHYHRIMRGLLLHDGRVWGSDDVYPVRFNLHLNPRARYHPRDFPGIDDARVEPLDQAVARIRSSGEGFARIDAEVFESVWQDRGLMSGFH
jgi:hypothetical protein